jgi:hypothetical protein
MVNDPDSLLVHDLPLEEARVSTTIVALPGQLTFFGDKLAGLSEEQMKMLQQTLPVAEVLPMNLYPYFSMLPVWNLSIRNKLLGEYNVVALFNWEDEPGEISFTAEELGISGEEEYLVYEFWTEKYIGIVKEGFEMNVPPHSVRLLAVHKIKLIPQWISSDYHVTQTAMELTKFEWNDVNRKIDGKIKLAGSFPLTMRLHVPDNYSLKSTLSPGVRSKAKVEGKNLVAVTFKSEKPGDYDFILEF